MVVAAVNARFGVPEVKRGLVAVGGALLRLPQRIPYQLAMELIFTGEFWTPLVRTLSDWSITSVPGGALAEALRLAQRIAANGPLAVRASKEIMLRAPQWPAEEAYDAQLAIARVALESQDAREGARAFAEKRPPVWRGM